MNAIYKLPDNIMVYLVQNYYKYELIQEIINCKELTHFGLINLKTGLTVDRDPLRSITQLKSVLEIATTFYHELLSEYVATNINLDYSVNKNLSDQYFLEINNGLRAYHVMIKNLADLIENIDTDMQINGAYPTIALAEHFAITLLLHINFLREQTPNRTTAKLSVIKQLQKGKKDGTSRRNEVRKPYLKTVDGAIKFINDNFATWYQSWKKYHNSTGKKPPKYIEIPKHFKSWFKKLDTETTATKTKGVNYYWDSHKKTTENPFISNFLSKYQD